MSTLDDMSGMESMGMDMGSDGMFRPVNQMLARTYCYLVAAFFASALLLKSAGAIESWSRSVSQPVIWQPAISGSLATGVASDADVHCSSKRSTRVFSLSHPTRPRNFASQAYATTLAIFREISYPQVIRFTRPGWTWLSPPPLGPSLVILTYWIIITIFLTTGSIVHDAYYWERVGFRAAWVSVTQVPFIFLLAGKVNIASFLFGSSYVDVNWLHRWASRTLLVTVTIHGSFFLSEWVRADFVRIELDMMPMVKYGLGLWAVLAWTTISSLIPLRRLCYEFFVLQHIVSAGVFLWLLHVHVPAYASYNVWMAVAFALSGRVYQFCVLLCQNIAIRKKTFSLIAGRRLGHSSELQALAGEITMLTVHGVGFSWKAGQHVLLWCPTLGPLESHPFTIANIPEENCENGLNKVQLIIRARSGFTRKLLRRAISSQASSSATVTVFLIGPFGNLPAWNTYETLVLISASTGASFTLPILEAVLNDPCCIGRVDCLLLIRHRSHIDGYLSRLQAAASHPRSSEVSLHIMVAVTGKQAKPICRDNTALELGSLSTFSSFEAPAKTLMQSYATTTEQSSSSSDKVVADSEFQSSIEGEERNVEIRVNEGHHGALTERGSSVQYTLGRPSLADFMREPVEASAGETSVVVCGGKSLTSTVRNCVATLSDERAVHKGTGAQGIHLHVEDFGLWPRTSPPSVEDMWEYCLRSTSAFAPGDGLRALHETSDDQKPVEDYCWGQNRLG